jgi:hypothetical protein
MQVIRIDTSGRALEGFVKVKKGRDNLMWVAIDDSGPWRITFDKPANPAHPFNPGSPFPGTPANGFLVPQGFFVTTMGAVAAATAPGTYKYRIRDANNPNNATNITDDPDVDVDP